MRKKILIAIGIIVILLLAYGAYIYYDLMTTISH